MTSPQEIRKLKKAASQKNPPATAIPRPSEPDGIVQFATDPEYLGCDLFPRQGTVLKMMTLDTANFTDFDFEVVGELMRGFVLDTDGFEYRGRAGIVPDLMERRARAGGASTGGAGGSMVYRLTRGASSSGADRAVNRRVSRQPISVRRQKNTARPRTRTA